MENVRQRCCFEPMSGTYRGVGSRQDGLVENMSGSMEIPNKPPKLEDSRTPGEISVQCFPFANSTWGKNGSWTRQTLRLDMTWDFMDKVVFGIEHVHLFPCKMQRNSRGVVVVTRGYVVSKSLYGNWLILCIFPWSKLDPAKTPTPGFPMVSISEARISHTERKKPDITHVFCGPSDDPKICWKNWCEWLEISRC